MLWYMYTEDCYLAMKRKKCESVELRWMNLCLLHTVVFYLLSLDSVLQGHVHKVTHVHNFLIETQKHQYPTFNGIRCIQGLAQHLTHSWAITMFYLFAHSGSHSLIQRPVFGKSLLWYPLTGWHFQQLHQLVHPLILLCPSERARGRQRRASRGSQSACPVSLPPSQAVSSQTPLSSREVLFKAVHRPGLSSRLSTAAVWLCTLPSSVHTLPCPPPAIHLSRPEFLLHMLLHRLSGQLFPLK